MIRAIRVDAILVALVVSSAFGVVSAQHQARKLFSELERERARAHDLEVEWGQLQLEQSTWAALVRVERFARDRLDMAVPAQGNVLVMEQQP